MDAARLRASMSRSRDLCSAWEASESEVRERYSTVEFEVVVVVVLISIMVRMMVRSKEGRIGRAGRLYGG